MLNIIYSLKQYIYYKDIYVIQHIMLFNISCLNDIGDHHWSSFWFSNKQHYLSKRQICLKDINIIHKLYTTYICCIIMLYTIWIHLRSPRTYMLPHRNQLILSIYCLASTVKWLLLDSRKARGGVLSVCDQTFWNLVLSTWRRCALVDMYGRMNVCVCVHSSICTGWLPSFSSSVIWHF